MGELVDADVDVDVDADASSAPVDALLFFAASSRLVGTRKCVVSAWWKDANDDANDDDDDDDDPGADNFPPTSIDPIDITAGFRGSF